MNTPRVEVVLRQEETSVAALKGRTVVLIDVLRATSTLTAALAAGAKDAWCFRTVREVFRARRRFEGRPLLLCGERGGMPVRGFDLGNSPRRFTAERCTDRTLLMTTTNGTRALQAAREAGDIVAACFGNLSAVAEYLRRARRPVVLLCAGTNGQRSRDDIACAGAIAERLLQGAGPATPNADEALRAWRQARRSLTRFLLGSEGGVPLVGVGLERDVRDCARRDRCRVVPRVVRREEGFRLVAVER